ncbi:MAG: hypothetical protein ABI262_21555 [Microcoleus sp.]
MTAVSLSENKLLFSKIEEFYMEPVSLTAIVTLVLTKVTEKASEILGEQVVDKAGKLLSRLHDKSSSTATAIELSRQQPLDYRKAVLDLEAAMKKYDEVAKAVNELYAEVNKNSKTAEDIKASAKALESHQSNSKNFMNIIEKSVNLAQGEGSSNNIYGNQYN